MIKIIVVALLLFSNAAFAADFPSDYKCLPYENSDLKDMSIIELKNKIDDYESTFNFALNWMKRNGDRRSSEEADKCIQQLDRVKRVYKAKELDSKLASAPIAKIEPSKAEELLKQENDLLKREIALLKQENETLKAQLKPKLKKKKQ